ncbi:MAG: hypothetical protein IPO04_03735 [Cytophagaceae bacterium]|nr:hypothetical protein [Cytophagaceae bacterium]
MEFRRKIGEYYDPLKAIKKYVQKNGVPYFGFFAETFIAPPDSMGYGVEEDHLEAIEADSTLGDLQASPVGSDLFMENFEKYLNWPKLEICSKFHDDNCRQRRSPF